MKPLPHIEFRVADLNAKWLGKSTLELMEEAGKAVAEEVAGRYPGRKITVICGTGNNGGDGLVCARYLIKKGFNVDVIITGEPKTEESKLNLKRLEYLQKVKRAASAEEIELQGDVVVDALLGTGIKGEVREPYRGFIEKLRNFKGSIVAVDLPSGMDSEGRGFFAEPELVVTFIAPKKGLEKFTTVTRQIGMPEEALKYAGAGDVVVCTRKRKEDAHKGEYGRILVIGGNNTYHGAPVLAGLAALKCGADIVYMLVPESISQAVRALSPEIIVLPYHAEHLTPGAISSVQHIFDRVDCIILGNGLGVHTETAEAVKKLVKSWKGKIVVDADALKLLGDVRFENNAVLTPHRKEAEYLCKSTGSSEEIAMEIAKTYNSVVLLKGSTDVIASPDGRIKKNTTGNPGMTSGGTGDVLAGVVAALFAQGGDALYAASGAAFLNGYAGDRLFVKKRYFFTAFDLLEELPNALAEIYTRLKM